MEKKILNIQIICDKSAVMYVQRYKYSPIKIGVLEDGCKIEYVICYNLT